MAECVELGGSEFQSHRSSKPAGRSSPPLGWFDSIAAPWGKTLKYRPGFPARFDSIEHARAFCREFFRWYNHDHRHSGIGLMSPATVHYGRAEQAHAERLRVLDAAYAATPERFVRRAPTPPPIPVAAWINKPDSEEVAH